MLLYWSAQSVAGDVDWGVVATAAGNSLLLARPRGARHDGRRAPGGLARGAVPGPLVGRRRRGDDDRLRAARDRRRARARVLRDPRGARRSTSRSRCSCSRWSCCSCRSRSGSARAALLQVPPRLEEAARALGPLAAAGRADDHDPARARRRARGRGARVPARRSRSCPPSCCSRRSASTRCRS